VKRVGGLAAALVALVVIGAVAAARHGHAAPRTLTGSSGPVSISGTPSRPVFVLTGNALRLPPTNPSGSPGRRRLCTLQIQGVAGHDYGDSFYVTVRAGRHGRRLFGAGRYHPQSSELDCIGIVVLSKSRRRISFTFGSAYNEFGYPRLTGGRRVIVVIRGEERAMLVQDVST
jgi:hypothetical protein